MRHTILLAFFLSLFFSASSQFCFTKFDPSTCKTYLNMEFALGGSLYNSVEKNLDPLFELKWGATRFITPKVGVGGILTASLGGGQDGILAIGPRLSSFYTKKDKTLEFYFSPSFILNDILAESGSKGYGFEFGYYQNNTKGLFIRHTRFTNSSRNRSLLLFGLQTRGKRGLVGSLISFVVIPVVALIAISGSQ